jgi:hypothetical protein
MGIIHIIKEIFNICYRANCNYPRPSITKYIIKSLNEAQIFSRYQTVSGCGGQHQKQSISSFGDTITGFDNLFFLEKLWGKSKIEICTVKPWYSHTLGESKKCYSIEVVTLSISLNSH